MRIVNVKYIDTDKYEYYVGRDIYENGTMLLKQDVKMTKAYQNLLLVKGIKKIYVKDEFSEGIEMEETVPYENVKKMKDELKNQFDNIQKTKSLGLNMKMINGTVQDLMDVMLGQRNLVYSVSQLRSMNEYLYEHSINVAISCIYTGILLQYNKMDLFKLGLGALLHDIGKVFVEKSILDKEGPLSDEEMEVIKTHPNDGYRFIADYYGDEISPQSKQIILQHHEKWNGSGYPNQMAGEAIYQMARICSIADTFDAMNANRFHQESLPLHMVSEYINSLGNIAFDQEIAKVFLSKVVKFKEGTFVELSNNTRGIVYAQNKNILHRPIVKILWDRHGKNVSHKTEFVDLTQERTLFIKGIVEHDVPAGD